ncbi:phospholipase A2 inhibitor and Ly6/PLAUR domain-containing protein-like [Bufo bufo]|uniref:phospholipase A2 inhibitor and Ly6/PLAUR domain-containing protein-like n=1 Tax=Bufo bufo TaxID=8384 RepID=UPI001ABDDA9D|nr:phospholipase A2 inhibitor and Ly6/PLAUR domain-containing protein-like [Bufo bufo]
MGANSYKGLVVSGDTLHCTECTDFSGRFCSGESVTCPIDSNVCMSSLVQYEINSTSPQIQTILQYIGTISPLTFVRGCGYSEDCTEVVVLRTPDSKIVTRSVCCNSDLCTPDTPAGFPEAPKNNITCPGCLQVNRGSCQDYLPVQCRGKEDHCFSYTLQLNNNVTITMAGCATRTACNLDLQEDRRKTICTAGIMNGAGSVYSSLLLLTATLVIIITSI